MLFVTIITTSLQIWAFQRDLGQKTSSKEGLQTTAAVHEIDLRSSKIRNVQQIVLMF
jgi:hypothetical protein